MCLKCKDNCICSSYIERCTGCIDGLYLNGVTGYIFDESNKLCKLCTDYCLRCSFIEYSNNTICN